jgi:FMN-dependent NADH-azoreductase
MLGSINVTIESPLKNYTEDTVPVYQKTVHSTSDGTSSMLDIKRLSISVTALSSDENWYVMLVFDNAEDYSITVEVQK